MTLARLGAFILAAGYSSRMGDFKPLMHLQGRTLLEWAASTFRGAGVDRICVVTGHRGEEIRLASAALGLDCVANDAFAQGMFSSVRVAAAAAQGLDAFFLLPVDIPLVRPAVVAALGAAYVRVCQGEGVEAIASGPEVLYPVYAGERGHPPLIAARVIPDILAHDGTGGLKTLLLEQRCLDVPVWDRGVLLDADTGDDFGVLERKVRRLSVGEVGEVSVLAGLHMPGRGLGHGQAVARVAVRLGEALNRHGHLLDLETLHNAALLHDVAKGEAGHEKRGGELLTAWGLSGLADIVAAHRDVPPPLSGMLTEREVVCLADKLVRGSRRIAVAARFEEKLELYQSDSEACAAIRGRLGNALELQALVERTCGQSLETMLEGVLA